MGGVSFREPVRIDTAERWHALAAPLRQRIVMLLEDDAAWSVRALAEATGRTPQALYRHLAILEAQGIVVAEAGAAARYRLVGPIRLVDAGGRFAGAYATCVDRVFRDAARMHRRPPGPGRLVSSNLAFLTSDEAREVQERLRAIVAELRAARAVHPEGVAERGAYHLLVAFGAADLPSARDEADAE